MSKKVIKSSNKNEKYNLKSVLDTDNIMSGVSLKTVTAIGCASIIASCNKDPEESKNEGNKDKVLQIGGKDLTSEQIKEIRKLLGKTGSEELTEDDIAKFNDHFRDKKIDDIFDKNGKIKASANEEITKLLSDDNKKTSEVNQNEDTFIFNNLSKEQKETLKEYGITNQDILDDFLKMKDNEGLKNKKISELFNGKDINDDNLRTKLEAYKNSKQQSTLQVSEEKVKKLKEFMQHKDDDYTIYNFYDNNIKTEEINEIYEKIKEGKLTPKDKDVNKNDSLAKKLKDIIENKNNIKNVRLAIFKKIVDKLSKDKEYFEFSLDKQKQFQINIKFTFKDEKGANKTETESKTYKPEDINIQEKIDIETHQIYTELSSLKEISKSSIDEAFKLENAKKDGKDIADGAGETKDLNAYLAVLKNNFDKLKDLNNINNDAIKTKIHGQLLKNIKAKLTDFVDKKLSTQVKSNSLDTNAIVAAMKSTGICKDDANVKDADSMKKNPIDNKFFLSAIIGTGGFMHNDYETIIDAMFTHFNDKHKVDNASKFRQNITDLKADDFTADANTKLKINNNTCTYFAEDSAPDLTGYAKFKNVINKINAIGSEQIGNAGNETFANGKTLADAADIDKVNKAFKAIHVVRAELDDVVNSTNDPKGIIKESELYNFLEKIVGKWKTNFKITYEKTAAATYDYDLSSEKYLSDGLLPIAVMVKQDYHNFNDITKLIGDGKILGDNGGAVVTGCFQLSLLELVFKYMSTKSLHDGTSACTLGDCTKENDNAAADNISLAANANRGTITKYYFATELKRIQDVISGKGTNPAKVQAFVDVVKAMNIPEKIKWNGTGDTIKVEPSIGTDNNKFSAGNKMINNQNIAYGDLGKYIIPILGISENSPHLIIGLLSAVGGNLKAIDGIANINYNGVKYAYDVTNNRACLTASVGTLTKKNTDATDKQKYSIGVCKNSA